MSGGPAEIDLRVGGRFRILMRQPDGIEHRATGTYREIDPPRRLVYTWAWETNPAIGATLITVEFLDRGASTEVVLRHEGLPSAEARSRHQSGWTACLTKLAAHV